MKAFLLVSCPQVLNSQFCSHLPLFELRVCVHLMKMLVLSWMSTILSSVKQCDLLQSTLIHFAVDLWGQAQSAWFYFW